MLSSAFQSRYEKGETDIPLSVVKRIAVAHNASIDYIAGMEGTDYETIAENADYATRDEIKQLKLRIEALENSLYNGKDPDKQ